MASARGPRGSRRTSRGLAPRRDACRAGASWRRHLHRPGGAARRALSTAPAAHLMINTEESTSPSPLGADCVWCYQVGGGGLVAGDAPACAWTSARAAALATQGTNKVYKHVARRRDDEEEDEEDEEEEEEEEDDTEGVVLTTQKSGRTRGSSARGEPPALPTRTLRHAF